MKMLGKILLFPFKVMWYITKLPFRIAWTILVGLLQALNVLLGLAIGIAIVVAIGYGLLLLAGPFFALGGTLGGIAFLIWAFLEIFINPAVNEMEKEDELERHRELVNAIKEKG